MEYEIKKHLLEIIKSNPGLSKDYWAELAMINVCSITDILMSDDDIIATKAYIEELLSNY